MKRMAMVAWILMLLASSALAWTTAELEQVEAAAAADNPTAEQKQLVEQYSDWANPGSQIDLVGGPDGFGYMFKDSDEPDVSYSWVDIQGTGTEFVLANAVGDENYVGPFDLGFTFTFYGVEYTQWWWHSNGVVTFTDPGDNWDYTNVEIPNDEVIAPTLFWFWDDLDGNNGALGYYETMMVGDEQACVISLYDYDEYAGSDIQDTITGQIIIFANGAIKYQYEAFDPEFDITSESIGIQNADATIGLQYGFNTDPLDNPYAGLAIMFEQLDPDASLEGTVTNMMGAPLGDATVTFNGMTTTTDGTGSYEFTGLYSGISGTVSASATGYYSASEDVTLVAGVNTVDLELEELPEPGDGDFFTEFEDGGFPFSTTSAEWEWGVVVDAGGSYPGPGEAYSGTSAWATNLDGLHGNTGGADWLVTDMGFEITSDSARIEYMHWYDYFAPWDGYNFNISTDGGVTWELLQPEGGYPGPLQGGDWDTEGWNSVGGPGDQAWAMAVYPLGDYVGETVYFGFQQLATTVVNHYGVVIDDFGLWGNGPSGPVTLDLMGTFTTIPPSGGTVTYDIHLESTLPNTVPGVAYWTDVTLPNGQTFGPLMNQPFTLVPFMDVTVVGAEQAVPALAPGGEYAFNGYVGYQAGPYIEDSFTFTKIGAAAEGVEGWSASGVDFGQQVAGEAATTLPVEYALETIYPNPFNPTTSVSVTLPDAAELNVAVFNVMGQQVLELASGQFNAGAHTFTLDGSALASGVYFVQATVPGNLDAIQKVTLLK